VGQGCYKACLDQQSRQAQRSLEKRGVMSIARATHKPRMSAANNHAVSVRNRNCVQPKFALRCLTPQLCNHQDDHQSRQQDENRIARR
jgi:hypothetical protein